MRGSALQATLLPFTENATAAVSRLWSTVEEPARHWRVVIAVERGRNLTDDIDGAHTVDSSSPLHTCKIFFLFSFRFGSVLGLRG
jgi:hypothetical protein